MQFKPENLTDGQTRLYFIDLLESIAIFLVLAYHGTNYEYSFLEDSGNVLFYLRYYFRTILSCCVPLFFFANGYLLLNRDFNLKKHIIKIIKLAVLTELWGIIVLFISMFIRHEFLPVKDFLVCVWERGKGVITHLWYMHALIVIYILFPLIKIVYDNRRDIFYFFISAAAIFTFGNVCINIVVSIAANLLLGKNSAYSSFNWFNDLNPFRGIYGYAFVYFCIGGIADDIKNKLRFLNKIWVNIAIILMSMLGLFSVGVALSNITNKSWDVVWYGYDTIFTFINVFCIFSLCTKYKGKENLFRKVITLVSTNTLGVYFIHVLFNQLLIPYVREFALMSNILGNIIYTLVILFASLVSVVIIKKIPLLKRLVM